MSMRHASESESLSYLPQIEQVDDDQAKSQEYHHCRERPKPRADLLAVAGTLVLPDHIVRLRGALQLQNILVHHQRVLAAKAAGHPVVIHLSLQVRDVVRLEQLH